MSPIVRSLASFGCGILFAIGLGLARLTLPSTIRDGLDVTGQWNPSMFVTMAAAVGVYFVFTRIVRRMRRPLAEARFALPSTRMPGARSLAGSAVFGAAWGTLGLCPGPAITSSLVNPSVLVFSLAMAAGVVAHDRVASTARASQEPPDVAARTI